MAKLRSPNYPALPLAEAVERIRKVYQAEHTHPASREVIAKDLGYNSLSGASLPIIAALRRYCLLVDAANGMRVSDDAVAVLELPESDKEHQQALRRCAFAPDLFADLRDEFGEKLPSDANLRHYLIKRKFLPKAADEVIRVYRDNLQLVGIGDEEYNGDGAKSTMDAQVLSSPTPLEAGQRTGMAALPQPPHIEQIPNQVGYRKDVCSLVEGPVTIQWPLSLSPDSFADLEDWLEMMKRKIQRSVAKDEAAPTHD